jgi:hypothetical protein
MTETIVTAAVDSKEVFVTAQSGKMVVHARRVDRAWFDEPAVEQHRTDLPAAGILGVAEGGVWRRNSANTGLKPGFVTFGPVGE